ncbi:Os02g0521800 [Oryza sativa Japonica Group]|uniref:Os02g0521800 protein n=2 Tax=Oryza sativa subsp. japonica TaxID=39947 RepID=B9F0A8_ORYSJ|nr:hypothetical protein OsJ_06945 [Oryza sativa Japonica Group]BAD26142.1 unknown protein [Oryza sativa Japonica Group]BAF08892.1 Os02g0521800 [Oryza sativa Japonica Group]BAS78957.1 Os02g0521800 [Oryza sativa Japonica Group]|eukprot:NP_001046978.1 Os02g0521800 [Oryza sativa Japonica Group]
MSPPRLQLTLRSQQGAAAAGRRDRQGRDDGTGADGEVVAAGETGKGTARGQVWPARLQRTCAVAARGQARRRPAIHGELHLRTGGDSQRVRGIAPSPRLQLCLVIL